MGIVRIAIVGSRKWPDLKRVYGCVVELAQWDRDPYDRDDVTIVSGGADGVDAEALLAARDNGLMTDVYLPDWNKYGKAAGMIRNKDIVDNSNRVIAFWDGESKGTLDTIKRALKAKKNLEVIFP